MNQQPKTILDWFEEARDAGHEWADAAIENAWQAGTAECVDVSLPEALIGAFNFKETTQGFTFWAAVVHNLPKNP